MHWDLLIEQTGRERLPTWRLARNPLDTSGDIPAERISDHRRRYLDFEGEIDGHRGFVRRVDHGPAEIERIDADELTVRLDGRRLRGRYEIVPRAGGRAVFRQVRTSTLDRR